MTQNTITPPTETPKPQIVELPAPKTAKETGGPKGPEPTRYGDWELKGKCVDF
jgi:hypothetical protein